MATSRVKPSRTRKGLRRGHLRDRKTFKGKVAMLKRASGLPDKIARGVVAKYIQRHEGA